MDEYITWQLVISTILVSHILPPSLPPSLSCQNKDGMVDGGSPQEVSTESDEAASSGDTAHPGSGGPG